MWVLHSLNLCICDGRGPWIMQELDEAGKETDTDL